MREQDAQDILRIIESIWQVDLGKEGRAAWRKCIEDIDDAELVTNAVFNLAKKESYRPSIALLRQEVEKMKAKYRVQNQLPWGSSPMPEWVRRWFYARFVKSPPDFRPLREQHPDFTTGALPDGATEWMPSDEYAEEAASVQEKTVVGALTAGRRM